MILCALYIGLPCRPHRISLGEASFNDLTGNGTIKIEGDKNAFYSFVGMVDKFNFWFNIVEP
ncbi:alkyl sulfatase C-terminal domain-containing protein [Chitinophaga barathri]|uniref:Alkyl sulfatase C-terminal domain-containing protein n=1 Tax=Chitinophaga barathri TaxID=1647451 RepID=A0A3N4MGJ8_9BACT|nr:hypothetical protein EG028_02025 [Chitinophaga barathri]